MKSIKDYWESKVLKAIAFFIVALLILTVFRFCFFLTYSAGNPELSVKDFFPAVWIGVRIDAKWLALSLAPAWIFLLISYCSNWSYKVSIALAALGFFCIVLLDAVNFGFFGFYKSPISPIAFGLFQDDTRAILETLWADWPIFLYLFVISGCVCLPFIICALLKVRPRGCTGLKALVLGLVLTLFLAVTIRGSVTKFPLRQEDFAVSRITFVNACVPNGAAALYEAYKAWKDTQFLGSPETPLRVFGFDSVQSAFKNLPNKNKKFLATAEKPNIVFAVMESMGRDIFFSHGPGMNTLGALEKALPKAVVFRNGLSIENGTFPSLEGLIFDTPITPISQSIYGRKRLEFSRIFLFKNAGYKTVFLTGAPERWRQVDETFKNFGFDEVVGQAAIYERFPTAEKGPWGIGDEWLFKYAEELLAKAEKDNQPIFLMILSTTNHPPFRVPDDRKTEPVDPDRLPDYVLDRKTNNDQIVPLLQTYQYATNALGLFVLSLEKDGYLQNTLIAATGDHNARLKYRAEGKWHHVYGVPVLFWLPEGKEKYSADPDNWVSHRDIIPTLLSLAGIGGSDPVKGRNLFDSDSADGAVSFINWGGNKGFTIGKAGMVSLKGGNEFDCFSWTQDDLVRESTCTKEQIAIGEIARAQRALSEYVVRKGMLDANKK